jgi:hypothetical protein
MEIGMNLEILRPDVGISGRTAIVGRRPEYADFSQRRKKEGASGGTRR